jgi:hypothetical protein
MASTTRSVTGALPFSTRLALAFPGDNDSPKMLVSIAIISAIMGKNRFMVDSPFSD